MSMFAAKVAWNSANKSLSDGREETNDLPQSSLYVIPYLDLKSYLTNIHTSSIFGASEVEHISHIANSHQPLHLATARSLSSVHRDSPPIPLPLGPIGKGDVLPLSEATVLPPARIQPFSIREAVLMRNFVENMAMWVSISSCIHDQGRISRLLTICRLISRICIAISR